MGLVKLGTLIAISPLLFFICSIIMLFQKEWGPAGIGVVLSIFLFWLLYVRKKK